MRARFCLTFAVAAGGIISAVCAAQNRYSVAGSVSNYATGEPVQRALVRIGPSAAFSDASGRFQMDGVPAGRYSAAAEKPGFFDLAQAGLASVPTMVAVGPGAGTIALKLVPESVIEGRVLNNSGEPIEDAQVQFLREGFTDGRKTLQPAGNNTTDDSGEFRGENLTPGKYYVRVLQTPVFAFGGFVGSDAASRQVYPEQCYPNAPDLDSAESVDLKPGESKRLDFTLSPKPAFRVSGTVAPAAPNGIFASVQDADGDETQVQIAFKPRTGRWTMPQVAPGVWNIVFRAQNQPSDAYYGEQRIEVRGSDIENVKIVLYPLPPIPVQVLNGPENGAPNIQLRLSSTGARVNASQYMAGFDPRNGGGPLLIRDVTPGTYAVHAQPIGAACIESISSGSIDLMRDPLVVTAGSPPGPIQVALRNDCATLTVTVERQGGAAGGFLLLLSEWPGVEPKTAWLQENLNSSISLGPLTPGVYHLYAVSDLNNVEYANPDVLRALGGQEITLAPNQQATAMVTVPGNDSNQ